MMPNQLGNWTEMMRSQEQIYLYLQNDQIHHQDFWTQMLDVERITFDVTTLFQAWKKTDFASNKVPSFRHL